jgi:hypothetical protein
MAPRDNSAIVHRLFTNETARIPAGLCACNRGAGHMQDDSRTQWLICSSARPRVFGPSRAITIPTSIDTPMKTATPGTP